MKRRLWHRIHDRAWHEVGNITTRAEATLKGGKASEASSSISGDMPWATICGEYSTGKISSHNFRRTSAVRDIVETVGPVDGRFYAKCIRTWDAKWLIQPAVEKIDRWGNPIRWAGFLLGTPRAFSPTTLRYLATAIWLNKNGHLKQGSKVLEIGGGFGGLAAMNAIVSGASTTIVDLPQVEASDMRMLGENDLSEFGKASGGDDAGPIDFVISNYAFTELNATIQQQYCDQYLRSAPHGLIISNSAVFAGMIQGRRDEDLVAWLKTEGIPAKLVKSDELLGPSDQMCGVTLIQW